MSLFHLFSSFFFIGMVNFGGGLSIIPLMSDLVVQNAWMTVEQVITMIAIAEATPGPISVNLATYAGYQVAGIPGAILATAGVVLPSLLIIMMVSRAYLRFKNSPLVQRTMEIVRPVVAGMVASVCVQFAAITLVDIPLLLETGDVLQGINPFSILTAIAVFILYNRYKIHPIILIMLSAILGILFL